MLLRLLVKIITFICFFSLNMQLNSTISFDINSACALSYLETSPYRCYTDLSEVLECFVKHEDHAYKYNFLPDESSNSNELEIKTYLLNSQEWPIEKNNEIPTTLWQHKLTLYIPHEAGYKQGLLYVSGGYNYNKEGKQTFDKSKENLDYKKIALTNKAPVIVIEDVPNQFLFINGQPKREDQILANTYRQVMEDPMKNAYLAGHLPMAKAVVKAMDATQEILPEIESFVLSGASKRGWAVWLTAIEDKRVSAIIPIVIDALGTQENIKHICDSYKGTCPISLRDYEAEGITSLITSASFADLMTIEDPLSYLNSGKSKYVQRFSIPKYIINASGDDFFVPDSSQFYFQKLPGNNYIRYLPHAMHYFSGNPVSNALNNNAKINEAVNSYFYFILNKTELPKVTWSFTENSIDITSSAKPKSVILWTANNEETRDFRFVNRHDDWHLKVKGVKAWLSKYLPISFCDTCYEMQEVKFACENTNSCQISAQLPLYEKGWQASFAELHYEVEGKEFVITTEVGITPDTYHQTF
jgi:PhoPQ-activated pathogenicity-related protein